VRVRVEIDVMSRQLYSFPAYGLHTLFADLGSWAGLWLFGTIFLGLWVRTVQPWGPLGPGDVKRMKRAHHRIFEEKIEKKRLKAINRLYLEYREPNQGFSEFKQQLREGKVNALAAEEGGKDDKKHKKRGRTASGNEELEDDANGHEEEHALRTDKEMNNELQDWGEKKKTGV